MQKKLPLNLMDLIGTEGKRAVLTVITLGPLGGLGLGAAQLSSHLVDTPTLARAAVTLHLLEGAVVRTARGEGAHHLVGLQLSLQLLTRRLVHAGWKQRGGG